MYLIPSVSPAIGDAGHRAIALALVRRLTKNMEAELSARQASTGDMAEVYMTAIGLSIRKVNVKEEVFHCSVMMTFDKESLRLECTRPIKLARGPWLVVLEGHNAPQTADSLFNLIVSKLPAVA